MYMCAHLFSVQLTSRRFMSSSNSLNYDRSFTAKRWSLQQSKVMKLWQLTCCLTALSGNDFKASVFAQRQLMKWISDGLLRQRKGLMIYNKIERVLLITK